jgi:hypothetical protein
MTLLIPTELLNTLMIGHLAVIIIFSMNCGIGHLAVMIIFLVTEALST